jgi:hypothetical protein
MFNEVYNTSLLEWTTSLIDPDQRRHSSKNKKLTNVHLGVEFGQSDSSSYLIQLPLLPMAMFPLKPKVDHLLK